MQLASSVYLLLLLFLDLDLASASAIPAGPGAVNPPPQHQPLPSTVTTTTPGAAVPTETGRPKVGCAPEFSNDYGLNCGSAPPRLPADSLIFTGVTKNPALLAPNAQSGLSDRDQWHVDTSNSGFDPPHARGLTYLYKCGRDVPTLAFSQSACAKLRERTSKAGACQIGEFKPLADPQRHETACASDRTTGVTAWTKEEVDTYVYRDACGWLGARCADRWDNAVMYVVAGMDVRGKWEQSQRGGGQPQPLERNMDEEPGVVKIYVSG